MKLLNRKSRLERLAESVAKPLPDVRSGLANPPKGVKPGLVAVGGAIGLTAGSAAVSALRRRSGDSPDRS